MVILLLNHENCFQYLVNILLWWRTDSRWITHTLGVKDADLILTYGMATNVRRLPVIPTMITNVLFTAKPSLPSVIS